MARIGQSFHIPSASSLSIEISFVPAPSRDLEPTTWPSEPHRPSASMSTELGSLRPNSCTATSRKPCHSYRRSLDPASIPEIGGTTTITEISHESAPIAFRNMARNIVSWEKHTFLVTVFTWILLRPDVEALSRRAFERHAPFHYSRRICSNTFLERVAASAEADRRLPGDTIFEPADAEDDRHVHGLTCEEGNLGEEDDLDEDGLDEDGLDETGDMGEKRASMVLYVPLRLFVVQGRHQSVRREDHHLVRRLVHVLDEEDNLRSSNRHLQPALCPQSQLTADAKQRLASFHTSRLDSAELAHTALVPIARASGLQIQQFHVASLLLAYITLSLSPHADGAEDDILPLMTSPAKDAPKSECCICGTPIDSGAEGETWRGHAQICTSHEGHTAHISCQRSAARKSLSTCLTLPPRALRSSFTSAGVSSILFIRQLLL
ncbi:uncharacterized protein B0I36DRAFT_59594 [Microdochium trichocladiopsis]|uniref:Uncharacterized protein n=1 Tax=Microdochium trichocladiopsis TaxID=1682393 RepID=A0A9P8XPX3_9PEZI|nr:uncharacterized protein B0I36DRAFT_59594 [Microdochium trichocladiopsis]KAH7009414.1 hypothetical protein B0I36DRAFT_59594 [Microdochium trichocladiopsis]